MNRKLTLLAAGLSLLFLSIAAFSPRAHAQSAGCSAFPGFMGGFLQEYDMRDFGPQPFNAGEIIQIAAFIDGTADPFPFITWYVTGNTGGTTVQSGSNLSFTIPTTQNYRIVIESTNGVDANIAASCTPAPPAGGGGGAVPPPAPQWSGFSDGRLNPDPAEAYSIFCGPGYVDVYVTFNGQGNLLARVSQTDLSVLNIYQNRQVNTLGTPLIVTRINETLFRFSGTNGNLAPAYGEKYADLAPCGLSLPVPLQSLPVFQITVYVVTPTSTPTPTPTPVTPTPTPDPDPDRDGVLGQDDLCPMFSYIASRYQLYGCRDTDGDGFVNPYNFDGKTYVMDDSNPNTELYLDQCPQVFGQSETAGNGCPDIVTAPVTVNTTLQVNQTQLPQSIANALFNSIIGQWVSVSLLADPLDCALPPEEINTNTTNYLFIPLCEGVEE